ncbi:MAG: ROK family protein [Prolixibacteraceae bacterium]|nr:ROK family protein [Prolixibacteraceae bacterium]
MKNTENIIGVDLGGPNIHAGKVVEQAIIINNDANCFVLGEKYFGKAQSCKSIVGLTIGTGMGSGPIFNGKLFEGKSCGTGEVGDIAYLDINYKYYCSDQFFAKEESVSACDVFNLAESGDGTAIQMFAEYGFHLGQAIKTVLYAHYPEPIILDGSLTKSYEYFKSALFDAVQDFTCQNVLENLKIEVSELEHSAIYGVASLCLISTNYIF